MDVFGRTVDYLRISITDRCNERCLYCMPEGYKGWESKPDHLTAEEIIRVVRVAAGLGFRKFRLRFKPCRIQRSPFHAHFHEFKNRFLQRHGKKIPNRCIRNPCARYLLLFLRLDHQLHRA